MSCKLRCPNCCTMCKEGGDEMKEAPSTYTVVANKGMNLLKCSNCGLTSAVVEWLYE